MDQILELKEYLQIKHKYQVKNNYVFNYQIEFEIKRNSMLKQPYQYYSNLMNEQIMMNKEDKIVLRIPLF
jgi:hypothetical protein